MSTTAIVPLKALAEAKGRLSQALDPAQRQSFAVWMAERVLSACQACDGIDDVLLVAGDEAAAEVGRQAGAEVLLVAEAGLRVALDRADARTAGCDATIIVAADLPEATADDLAAVLAAGAVPRAVVIAPTHDGGTGALLRRPPSVMGTAYGPGSAAAHVELARAAGVEPLMLRIGGLARDVDTPAQLPAALALVARDDVGSRAR